MKVFAQRIYENPKYAKVLHWGKLITITGSAQIVVQAIGLICGILVIRLLSTKEYALYTLANTMLGTIILLSDGGIASGVMAEGGKVWEDRYKLGKVLATGLHLRNRFAICTLLVAIPILFYLLLSHGASIVMSILIALSLIPVFFASLSDTMLEIPFKLKQAIVPLQKNQVGANIGRLVLTAIALFTFPFAYIAILAAGLPRMYANYRLRKKASDYVDLAQKGEPVIKKEILTIVKRVFPGAIYFSISGQITIWLVSIFGTTDAIAQFGALGRLTMMLTIFSILFSTLVIPRFARIRNDRKTLLLRFFQVQAVLLLINSIIVLCVFSFSDQLLKVIGKSYSGLNSEFLLMTVGGCISMTSGLTHSISLARGWILPPLINILGNLFTQICLIIILDMTLIKNVLLFSILNSSVAFIMLFTYFIFRINQHRVVNL